MQAVVNYSAFSTDRSGLFYVGIRQPISSPYPGLPFVDDGLNYSISAYGIDGVSGLPLSARAPIGSSVVSAITSLIYDTGDQALVKHALQLDNLGFALNNPNRDLRTFSWVRAMASADSDDVADARRVRASNIRLHAYLQAIDLFKAGPGASFFSTTFGPDTSDFGAILKANPQVQIYTAKGAETILRAAPRHSNNNGTPYRDDVIAAAAHLLTVYSVAIGPVMTDDDVAASYMLGTHGFFLRTLWELTNANTADAAAQVMAISVADIYQRVAPFAERLPLSTNSLFAVPDFFFVPADDTMTIPFYDPGSNGSPSLASNDSTWFVPGTRFPLSLNGVTVPTRFAASISVTRQPDQSVIIQTKPGFTGLAWFDYEEQTPSGITASGRAYVIVK